MLLVIIKIGKSLRFLSNEGRILIRLTRYNTLCPRGYIYDGLQVGTTPLMNAVLGRNVAVASELLARGVHVNGQSKVLAYIF
jgi:hypothetical protein